MEAPRSPKTKRQQGPYSKFRTTLTPTSRMNINECTVVLFYAPLFHAFFLFVLKLLAYLHYYLIYVLSFLVNALLQVYFLMSFIFVTRISFLIYAFLFTPNHGVKQGFGLCVIFYTNAASLNFFIVLRIVSI